MMTNNSKQQHVGRHVKKVLVDGRGTDINQNHLITRASRRILFRYGTKLWIPTCVDERRKM